MYVNMCHEIFYNSVVNTRNYNNIINPSLIKL